MNYCTATYFLLFLPAAVLVYQVVPQKWRKWVLLLESLAFYINISRKRIIFLLLATAAIYLVGLLLEFLKNKQKEKCKELPRQERKAVKEHYRKKELALLAAGIIFLIGMLLVLKYTAFFLTNVNNAAAKLGSGTTFNIPQFVLPLGISFYTMSAVSYIADVYLDKIPADHNPARLALFLIFFPCAMEGPICRYSDVTADLWEGKATNWHNLTFAAQRIAYGLFKKFIIADRLNTMIKTIYDGYAQYDGGIVFIGMVAYVIQLYAEFSGTMDIVIGSGEAFGFKLPENFRHPLFSKSISEFWTRWHITLGTWFKDYIFYPVSLSEPMKKLTKNARKKLGNHYGPMCTSACALFCVWICNGLWHGSAWSYIFYGMYHFFWILLENIIELPSMKLLEKLHIDRNGRPWTAWRITRTLVIVNVGELFFRANGLRNGLAMFKMMVTSFSLRSINMETFGILGLDGKDMIVAALGFGFVLLIDILQEKGVHIRESIAAKPAAVRWACYYALVMIVIVFGAYGMNYIPVDPIYAGF